MPHEPADPSQTGSTENQEQQTPDVGQLVNSAITAHMRRFTEKVLPGLFAEALKPINEKLAAPPPPPPTGDDDKPSAKGSKANAEILALQKQLEDFKAAAETEKRQRLDMERKTREERAFGDFRGELAKQVKPEFVDVVAHYLFGAKRMVTVEDDGTPYVKQQIKNMIGEVEEHKLPLQHGVSEWLKSDEAKAFLPAPSTNAAPPKPRGVPMPSVGGRVDPSKMTDDQKIAALAGMMPGLKQK